MKRIDEGIIALNNAIEAEPENAMLYNSLGNIQLRQEKSSDAIASYKKAIALQANYLPAHNNLGRCYYQLGKLEDAKSAYQQAVNIDNSEVITVLLPDDLGSMSFNIDDGLHPQKETLINWKGKLIAPKKNEQLTVSFSHENPICQPSYRQHSRSLKKVLQELKISPWQRKRLPFIYYNEILVAVAGHFICKEYIVEEDSDDGKSALIINWLNK
jgi:tRNA(Ile)-lysidine synthetase-like protein